MSHEREIMDTMACCAKTARVDQCHGSEFVEKRMMVLAMIAEEGGVWGYLGVGVVVGVLVWGVMVLTGRSRVAAGEMQRELLREQISKLEKEKDAYQNELLEKQDTLSELRVALVKSETQLEAQREYAHEQLKVLDRAEESLSETFQTLSADALRRSQAQFLEMAESKLKGQQQVSAGELEKRQQAVAALVKPLSESLVKVERHVSELEKQREGAYAGLTEQVKQIGEANLNLQKQTGELVKALRQPTGRGQWGELQLRRVVEMAGMLEYCDFQTQVSVRSEDGVLRPDLVVNLPGGHNIVVDAKATMSAYLEAVEAESEEARQQALRQHTQQVKTQMKLLSQKRYHEQFAQSPEFVVLFLPSEAFFSAALSEDATLIEQSTRQGIVLATPTTLIALLRVVAQGWKQESFAQNAREISEVGAEFYRRILTFVKHLDKLGHSLESTVKHYNQAVGSLEGRLLKGARRLEELGVTAQQEAVNSPKKVETTVRAPQIEERSQVLEQDDSVRKGERLADVLQGDSPCSAYRDFSAEGEGFGI